MQLATAGEPVQIGRFTVGRRSVVLVDAARGGRRLDVEVWYPASESAGSPTLTAYEVLPGISFASSLAHHEPPVHPGRFPVIVLSHGRTGNRLAYSMLAEAIAGRGAVVVAPDHPGDVMQDWLSGNHADDRTNEINRLADAHVVVEALLAEPETSGPGADGTDAPTDVDVDALGVGMPRELREVVDPDRIVFAGHSYGAYTAFAGAAGARGVDPHPHVRAVIALQPYTRAMSDSLLGRVVVPTLLVVSELDRTTPPASDAERPWALLRGEPTWRLDLTGAGHHAESDVPLYAELVDQIEGVPDIVRQYLQFTAAESAGAGCPPWRETVRTVARTIWSFLDVVLELDPAAGLAAAEELAATPSCTLRRR